MFSIGASTLIGLGVASLYATWRSALPSMGRLLGWTSILLGTAAWSEATGSDRGIAIALICLCVSALCFVGLSALLAFLAPRPGHGPRRGNPQRKNRHKVAKAAPSWRLGERVTWSLLAGPCAAILAFTIALASHQLMLRIGALPANALVTELFLFPVLWAVIGVWSLMAPHPARQLARVALLQTIASFLLLVLFVPG